MFRNRVQKGLPECKTPCWSHFFYFIMILDVHVTSGDWLSSLHTSDCQSEPGIPECELYNVNLSVSLLAVYLYQLLSCLLIKEAIISEQCTYRFLRRGGSLQPISIASTLSSVACVASYWLWPVCMFCLKIMFWSHLKSSLLNWERKKKKNTTKTTSVPLVCLLMNLFFTCGTFLSLILSNSFLSHALWHWYFPTLPSAGDKWRHFFPQCGGLLEDNEGEFLLKTPSASFTC